MKDMDPTNRKQIYLDFNASTPIDPGVEAVMHQTMESVYGNPSSPHWAGSPARIIVESARQKVASLLACKPGEIVFTSGATESNNLAIQGSCKLAPKQRRRILASSIEHKSVLEPCTHLAQDGRFLAEKRSMGRGVRQVTVAAVFRGRGMSGWPLGRGDDLIVTA